MENNIPTAKDFGIDFEHTKDNWGCQFSDVMTAFTRLHVEAALKAASENAITRKSNCHCGFGYPKIDRDSILKSYPLDKIK